ncbi:MAG: hypothetical protein E4H10_04785 [Bacteroidia bacterium]|nr:MAG: hypothetical protein E4H10_04785 [Bacteroidia bacterium]
MWLKRKVISLGVFLATLILCSGWMPHKFYVSLTEFRYNSQTERFEVSIRMFPDDLDRALLERTGIQTQLSTEFEHEKADSILKTYLLESFSLQADGNLIAFSYLGKESESDAVWCYLESTPVSGPRSLYIRHELLTEIFPDQVNIVQVYTDTWNKGLLLNRNQSSGKLTVGE